MDEHINMKNIGLHNCKTSRLAGVKINKCFYNKVGVSGGTINIIRKVPYQFAPVNEVLADNRRKEVISCTAVI